MDGSKSIRKDNTKNRYESFNNYSMKSCAPAENLKSLIYSYTWIKNYSFRGNEFMRPVPNGYVEMVIHLHDNALDLLQDGKRVTYNCFLVGLYELDYPTRIKPKPALGFYETLGIKFSFHGLLKLLGVRPAEITNKVLELEDILDNKIKALQEQLNTTNTFREKVFLLDSFFLEQMNSKRDLKLVKMISVFDQVDKLNNTITVEGFAREFNLSYRTLQRHSKQGLGVCPREYLKIKRLNIVCKMLKHYPRHSIHEIIHDCGYYDQSHFIREFKQVFRSSPIQFLENCNSAFQISRPYEVL